MNMREGEEREEGEAGFFQSRDEIEFSLVALAHFHISFVNLLQGGLSVKILTPQ